MPIARLFGLDLAFGADDNRPPVYDRAEAANTGFIRVFEELLYELWRAMSNVRNIAGENQADDDRIFRLTEELAEILRSRRQTALLSREELAAATALGWIELTLSADTPVVLDMRAQATAASDRLQLIAQKVGMAAHSKAASFFSMAQELSTFPPIHRERSRRGPAVLMAAVPAAGPGWSDWRCNRERHPPASSPNGRRRRARISNSARGLSLSRPGRRRLSRTAGSCCWREIRELTTL